MHFGHRQVQGLGYHRHGVLRDVAERVLNRVQDGQQRSLPVTQPPAGVHHGGARCGIERRQPLHADRDDALQGR